MIMNWIPQSLPKMLKPQNPSKDVPTHFGKISMSMCHCRDKIDIRNQNVCTIHNTCTVINTSTQLKTHASAFLAKIFNDFTYMFRPQNPPPIFVNLPLIALFFALDRLSDCPYTWKCHFVTGVLMSDLQCPSPPQCMSFPPQQVAHNI